MKTPMRHLGPPLDYGIGLTVQSHSRMFLLWLTKDQPAHFRESVLIKGVVS